MPTSSSTFTRNGLSGVVGTGGVARCCPFHGSAAEAEDGGGRSRIDVEVADEVIEGHAIRKPVEQLLHRQTSAPEAGRSTHSTRIDPDRFLQRHCWLGFR